MKRLFSACLLSLAFAVPAFGLDLENMSDTERKAFGEAVRSYLVANPDVLLEVIAELEARQAQDQASFDENLVASNYAALFEDKDSYAGGNLNGDITVVEFIDYKCGYCKRAHPEVTELVEGDGNIRIIYKEFPILGDESVLAAQFAISVRNFAGDAAYQAVSNDLMEARGKVNGASLKRLAKAHGLDFDAIETLMGSDAVNDVIAANHALGARLQVTGTPGFVFNTQMVRGYIPLGQMQSLVASIREN